MNPRMPPLPQAAMCKDGGWRMNVAGVECVLSEWEPGAVRVPPLHYFTADQLLSAQRAAWNAAMEAAAKLCEEKADAEENIGPLFPRGKFQGALDCASAIRSLKEPDHE